MLTTFQEKRKDTRVNLSIPVHYQIRGTSDFSNTLSEDISVSGICFADNSFIRPDTHLVVEIALMSRILRAIGRVNWSSPIAHSDRYRSGVEFVDLGDKGKSFINDYISMQTGKI
jgi:hypothetical protein